MPFLFAKTCENVIVATDFLFYGGVLWLRTIMNGGK